LLLAAECEALGTSRLGFPVATRYQTLGQCRTFPLWQASLYSISVATALLVSIKLILTGFPGPGDMLDLTVTSM